MRSMCYSINDPEYPTEWVYVDNKPTCTKWVKWDWGNDGDPDDPDNPKVPLVDDPNQLVLFSVADDVLQYHDVKTKESALV
ncbi:MAG: hypothetical protein KDC92_16955 [Bacteroidetes bacterium]|nr:hypothetical protein [Bacteroidota bacterium]